MKKMDLFFKPPLNYSEMEPNRNYQIKKYEEKVVFCFIAKDYHGHKIRLFTRCLGDVGNKHKI